MTWRLTLIGFAAALTLAGCGGGDQPELVPTSAVKVVGDSLNDSGTFGFKYTVQGTPSAPHLLWTEHVAAAVGVPALCPRYTASDTTVVPNPAAQACTNHAVAGGRINVTGTDGDTTPFSIVQQLKDVAAAGHYGAHELLLVDGGGNDIAALVEAYLADQTGGGDSYRALLGELLKPAQMADIADDKTSLAAAGTLYMTALADLLADTLTAQALDKGAQRIVVITAPDVTLTPRFRGLLAVIGATSSPDAAAAVKGLANNWVSAFNNQLKARLGGNSKVAVVDFYAKLNQWVALDNDSGLTNGTDAACPADKDEDKDKGAFVLPTYTISTCTAESLSAAPPEGESADWWKTYVFSDNFHGSPRTNELMGQLVIQALDAKNWR